MRRLALTLLTSTLLIAWASAQPATTNGPLAGEQRARFQSNRKLLEDLVEHSVMLANADTPVAKVKACHETTRDLGRAIKAAIDRSEPDHVAELTEYLSAVISEGLTPTIVQARRTIPKGTEAERELLNLMQNVMADSANYEQSIPALGQIGTSDRVRDARGQLEAARQNMILLIRD